MSDAKEALLLYKTSNRSLVGEVRSNGLDVFFPDEVRGWSDVLDARIPPYTEQSLEEVCHFAEHVRKYYILVTQSWADKIEA